MPYQQAQDTFEVYKGGDTTRDIKMLVNMVLLVRGFRNKLDEELRKIQQSTARMETLSAILNMQGDKSQSDVARRLRIEGATVTRMIDILSSEGLVERKPAPHDRRVNLISITPEGEEAVRRIFKVYDRVRNHILQDIAPEQVDMLSELIDTMLGRLDEPLPTAIEIEDLSPLDRTGDALKPKS